MTKTSPRKRTARARRRADQPLSPRQLARRLRTLPGWEAEGGNRELVGRYILGTTPSAVFAATAPRSKSCSRRARSFSSPPAAIRRIFTRFVSMAAASGGHSRMRTCRFTTGTKCTSSSERLTRG